MSVGLCLCSFFSVQAPPAAPRAELAAPPAGRRRFGSSIRAKLGAGQKPEMKVQCTRDAQQILTNYGDRCVWFLYGKGQ